jgi:hypothetical protein
MTVLVFGIGFLVVVVGLAQLLAPPPKGYVPPEPRRQARRGGASQGGLLTGRDAPNLAVLCALVHVRLRGRAPA